jgi:hypothetical protein
VLLDSLQSTRSKSRSKSNQNSLSFSKVRLGQIWVRLVYVKFGCFRTRGMGDFFFFFFEKKNGGFRDFGDEV